MSSRPIVIDGEMNSGLSPITRFYVWKSTLAHGQLTANVTQASLLCNRLVPKFYDSVLEFELRARTSSRLTKSLCTLTTHIL